MTIKVSKQCEDAIKQLAPKHHASITAPNSWEALQGWHRKHGKQSYSMPVYSEASKSTIFSSEQGNHAFRAWHDSLHLENGLDFSLESELKVADIQDRELRLMGISEHDRLLVHNDTAGQVWYYYTHKKYIQDQARFALHMLAEGDKGYLNYKEAA